ncbi:MAG: SPOR domain-containing protein [Fibrobacteraceae bacterium]|nr:SPOR domain-containing protein [Fibrobacteraceae bacterium]
MNKKCISFITISLIFTANAFALSLADAQKQYVTGNWVEAAKAYETVCPTLEKEAQPECLLWNILALSQIGKADEFTKAAKRLDSLILQTSPQKNIYADLLITRAQFELYLGKYDRAAASLEHAIETSQSHHALVLQKVCKAILAKNKSESLASRCANISATQALAQPSSSSQAAALASSSSVSSSSSEFKPAPSVPEVPKVVPAETPKEKPTDLAKTASAADSVKKPTTSEKWVLQLGAFSVKDNATLLIQNLKKRKINCNMVEHLQDSGKILYLVQTEFFDSKEKAVDFGAKNLSPLNVEYRAIKK